MTGEDADHRDRDEHGQGLQAEFSMTQMLDKPVSGRVFFAGNPYRAATRQ